MTTQILFNQFAYTDRLARAGFTPDQARASAEALETALSEAVVTKSDIDRSEAAFKSDVERAGAALRADIAKIGDEVTRVETALKSDIDRVETALKSDIDRVETTLRADITELKLDIANFRAELAKVELKIAEAKNDTLKWIFTFNLALVGAIFAIVKFVH